jgi:4-hydroxybenzoate polyprenyltransferase
MQTLRKILDFHIKSSIHVGFAVFCLVQITGLSTFGLNLKSYSYLVFFGTIIGYNFLKYFEWIQNKKWFRFNFVGIALVSGVSCVGFSILFLRQSYAIQLFLALAFGFVLFYPLVRKLGWLKLFFVSFVISFVTVFIPLEAENKMDWLLFCQRFFMLCALIVPFEILDSKDDLTSLQTLPQLFGVKKTKRIGYCLLGIAFLLKVLNGHREVTIEGAFIHSLIAVAIYFSSLKKTKYYTLFWVESIPILWWVLLSFSTEQF